MAALVRAAVVRSQCRQLWRLFPRGHGLRDVAERPRPEEACSCLRSRAFSAGPPTAGGRSGAQGRSSRVSPPRSLGLFLGSL
ncbi:mCG13452 [Mus musculus]|nr:mCG13452 [Mus musculus]